MPDEGLITHTLTISVSASFLGLRRVSMLYTHLSANPAYCDSEWIQTIGPYLRRVLLYSTELPNHKHNHFTSASVKDCRANCIYNLIVFADGTGLEPATFGVTSRHSNQLNYPSKLHYRSLTNFYFLLLVNFCFTGSQPFLIVSINFDSNLSNLESN